MLPAVFKLRSTLGRLSRHFVHGTPLAKTGLADPLPVRARQVLSCSEQRLYLTLRKVLTRHTVFAQVSLSQFIALEPGAPWVIRNHYNQLVADFLVCDAKFKPVLVIELDGASHDHPRRQASDARKAAVLAAADIELIRINAGALPGETSLKSLLPAALIAPASADPAVL